MVGKGFLPPINHVAKRNMSNIPHVKFDRNERENQRMSEQEICISSLDPCNFSMPKYSDKYHNEKNAGAFRHLLGGRREASQGVAPNTDIHNSAVQFYMHLRNYDPKMD